MLEWFTTIPGILVICGVILLVIAIILFAVSAKKDKKENVVNEPINNNVEVNNMEVNDIPEVQPLVDVVTTSVEEPVVEPVVDFAINDIPAVTQEPVTPEVVMIPDEEPVINIPDMEPISTEVNEPTMVYGGEQPIVDFPVEEKPVTIYGGNDPLEATQKLPRMEENHVPYGGEYPEINISEPVVEQPVIEPVVEPVTPIATIDFSAVNEPEVVVEPVMENVVSEPVVEPVVEPVQPVVEEKVVPVVEEL